MPACINKIKRTCRLCLMSTERHKRYELFVKSEVVNYDPVDKDDAAASEDCQQDVFSNMMLHEKVEYCCGIRLAPKSQLPSKICGKCFYMLHMWFNFRQMSCNSQIFLSSQTNIKLEDDSIARNSPELQKMRDKLLRDKEKKEDIEFISSDPVKDADNKVNYSIEKTEEATETEVLLFQTVATFDSGSVLVEKCTTTSKSNDEVLDDSNAQICTGEEAKKSHQKIYSINDEEEEDCLAEICVEEAFLKNANNEEVADIFMESMDNQLSGSYASLEQDKDDCNDGIADEPDINYAASNVESQKIMNDGSSLCDKEETDENGDLLQLENKNSANLCDNNKKANELEMNSPSSKEDDNDSNFETLHIAEDNLSKSSGTSDYNEDIERDIDFLLAESDKEDLESTNIRYKSQHKHKKRKPKTKKKKTAQKRISKKSLLRDKETLQQSNNNTSPQNTESKKSKQRDKYICNICGNILKSYITFYRHMETHTKKKPYKCELCMKAFRSAVLLKRHMPAHTGEKRYKCKYCNMHYTDVSSRHRHEKTHMENPEYNCDICGKRFMYKTVLRRHIQLHSGEKEYSCAVCNTSFALPHHLKNHIKTTAHLDKQKAFEALGFKIVFETRETSAT